MVQWYEYTGILGGSAWILLLNVLFFKLIFDFGSPKMIQILAVLLVPIGFSALRYYQVKPKKNAEHKILVVQPNIDPYEKFNSGGELAQVDSFIALAEKNLQANTELVVLPETAIVEYLDEDEINNEESIRLLMRFIHKHPGVKILTGASTYRFFKKGEKLSETARKAQDGNFYDSYNTAILIGPQGVETIYHKAKFVPGVEKMPYPKLFGFLEYFSIDMGGISGSLGHDDKVLYFETGTGLKIAPAICYESIYGEFLGHFMQKGANTIFIVTNDGWWKDTDGYRQHMFYGTLRAIEHRCQIVRCANTGTSCFIDERGRISNKTKWWKAETFTTHVVPATKTTFYSRYGDLIGKLSSYIAIVFLLGSFVRRKTKKATN
jgi:apolipoprotein N-acyltransferase